MEYEWTSPPRHTGRRAIIVVLLVAIIGVLLLQKGVFVVREVTVEGAALYPPEEIVRLADIRAGQSIFSIDQTTVAQNLSRDRYLLLDSIYINYPSELILRVRQRMPRAAVSTMGVLVMVDERGRVLEISNHLDTRLQVPVVTGMEVAKRDVGQDIAARDQLQVEAMLAVLDELNLQQVTARASELNVANLDNLYLITQGGMKIMLGDKEDMEGKIAMMRAAFETLEAQSIFTGSLDVSTVIAADYREIPVVIKPFVPDPTAVPNELVGI